MGVRQQPQDRVSQHRQRDPYVLDTWGCADVLQAAKPEGLPEQCASLTFTRPRVRCCSRPGAEQQHASRRHQRYSSSSSTFLFSFFKRETHFFLEEPSIFFSDVLFVFPSQVGPFLKERFFSASNQGHFDGNFHVQENYFPPKIVGCSCP